MKTASRASRDRHQKICFAIALWNGRDPILKERLFGLTGNEGNHGEDVKECYYYLDSTPTHSYMKYLYKYPQAEFPYDRLVNENRERGRGTTANSNCSTPECSPRIAISMSSLNTRRRVSRIFSFASLSSNRGPEPATLHRPADGLVPEHLVLGAGANRSRSCGVVRAAPSVIELNEPDYGKRWTVFDGSPDLLFTENETNFRRFHDFDDGSRIRQRRHQRLRRART